MASKYLQNEPAIKTLGIAKEEILVIEDSVTGVQAATGVGLSVIGFLGGSHILPEHGEKLIRLGASGLIQNFEEFKQKLTVD